MKKLMLIIGVCIFSNTLGMENQQKTKKLILSLNYALLDGSRITPMYDSVAKRMLIAQINRGNQILYCVGHEMSSLENLIGSCADVKPIGQTVNNSDLISIFIAKDNGKYSSVIIRKSFGLSMAGKFTKIRIENSDIKEVKIAADENQANMYLIKVMTKCGAEYQKHSIQVNLDTSTVQKIALVDKYIRENKSKQD